jgi:hypothetical protein
MSLVPRPLWPSSSDSSGAPDDNSEDSSSKLGKVVRFDPALRREKPKPGESGKNQSGASQKKGRGFGASAAKPESVAGPNTSFRIFRVVQYIVVLGALFLLMRSCGFF